MATMNWPITEDLSDLWLDSLQIMSYLQTSLRNGKGWCGVRKFVSKNVIECEAKETPEALSKAINSLDKSYVIISKIKPGNIEVQPIPIDPLKIKYRSENDIFLIWKLLKIVPLTGTLNLEVHRLR